MRYIYKTFGKSFTIDQKSPPASTIPGSKLYAPNLLQILTSHAVFLTPFRILYAAALTSSKPTRIGSSDSPVTGFKVLSLFTKPEATPVEVGGEECSFRSFSVMILSLY